MALVAGIDSSTQSTKVVVCDADDGTVLRQTSAPHPDGTEVDPAAWWSALQSAVASAPGMLEGVEAIAVGGQQHGMVALDGDGRVIRPALLWNDVRSAPDAADLVEELGGPARWAEAVGSVPVASFTVTKLRWLAHYEPQHAEQVETVCLPHDWVSWCLAGGGEAGRGAGRSTAAIVTDRGDASGTGYWSPAEDRYRQDLVALAIGHPVRLPRVAGPFEAVAEARELAPGALLAPGTGDNMAAALGLGMAPGDVAVSLGTSGTVFLVSETPTADPRGLVAGFADATGVFLPLVCTLNAARVPAAIAALLGVDLARLDELALAAPPGADGLTFLPYLDGERTPDLPDAKGLLAGMTRANATPENLARAAIEGVLCAMAAGLEALADLGLHAGRGLLIGGARAAAPSRRWRPSCSGWRCCSRTPLWNGSPAARRARRRGRCPASPSRRPGHSPQARCLPKVARVPPPARRQARRSATATASCSPTCCRRCADVELRRVRQAGRVRSRLAPGHRTQIVYAIASCGSMSSDWKPTTQLLASWDWYWLGSGYESATQPLLPGSVAPEK